MHLSPGTKQLQGGGHAINENMPMQLDYSQGPSIKYTINMGLSSCMGMGLSSCMGLQLIIISHIHKVIARGDR